MIPAYVPELGKEKHGGPSIEKVPVEWTRHFDNRRRDFHGAQGVPDPGHKKFMQQLCAQLQNYLKNNCPVKKKTYEQMKEQLEWCNKNLPPGTPEPAPGFGPEPEPITDEDIEKAGENLRDMSVVVSIFLTVIGLIGAMLGG